MNYRGFTIHQDWGGGHEWIASRRPQAGRSGAAFRDPSLEVVKDMINAAIETRGCGVSCACKAANHSCPISPLRPGR